MPKVKFGDVVKDVKTNIDRNNNSCEYFIAGEHMESENLHLTSKGRFEGSDVGPAFIRLFKPGQVLYGSRRTYLKKVAVADFTGITSNTTFVLETKDQNRFMQELLPFVMLTSSFTDYAVKNSKGSTNPYILFSDLENFEFELPDVGDQSYLSETLWAFDATKEAYKRLLTMTDELVKSQFIEMFGDPLANPKGWPCMGLMDIGDCKNGMNFASGEIGESINCLGVGDFKDLSVIDGTSELPKISLNKLPSAEYLLHDEDIVFVRSNGNKSLVGRCLVVYPHGTPTTYSGFCIRYRKRYDNLLIQYLLQVLKAPTVRKQVVGRGANIQNLNQQILASLNIPIPPLDLQLQFSDFVQSIDKSKFAIQQCQEKLERSRNALMEKAFG